MSMWLNGEPVSNMFREHAVRDTRTGDIVYVAEDEDDAAKEAELRDLVGLPGQRVISMVVQRTVYETEWKQAGT